MCSISRTITFSSKMKFKVLDEPEDQCNMDNDIEEFETMTKNAARVQKETLQKILEQNCNVEYLQDLGLEGRTDPESFKARVPLVTHEDLEPYIQRIVDGDTSPILTGEPVTTLSLRYYTALEFYSYVVLLCSILVYQMLKTCILYSSGTTQGKSKFLPFNEETLRSTMQIYRTSFAFINRYNFFPTGNLALDKSFDFSILEIYICNITDGSF